jgi:hypothetical protein
MILSLVTLLPAGAFDDLAVVRLAVLLERMYPAGIQTA